MFVTRSDATDVASRIDLKNISEVEARVLMSVEHKALGYRPPTGSLAAEAQAAASKNSVTPTRIPEEHLTKAALEDALRIKKERETNEVDVSAISKAQPRKLTPEEHKALGNGSHSESLASRAQGRAINSRQDVSAMQTLAQAPQRTSPEGADIDLDFIGEVEARRLLSEEHKALGYRPPQGSLAAAAQAAAAKHPHAYAGLDIGSLAKAAWEDARKIEAERRASKPPETKPANHLNTSIPG